MRERDIEGWREIHRRKEGVRWREREGGRHEFLLKETITRREEQRGRVNKRDREKGREIGRHYF